MTSNLLAVVTLQTDDVPNFIHIYEDDDIELLVTAFCELNQITEVGKQFIITEIKKHLNSVNKSTLDIILQAEYQDQQQSNKDNQYCKLLKNKVYRIDKQHKDVLIVKQSSPFQQKPYSKYFIQQDRQQLQTETINQRNLVEQQNVNGRILNYNQKISKPNISPNYRYEKTSQKIKQRFTTIFTKQNDYQQTNNRKKIFDADQPKIKYIQDLKMIKNIFRQLDNDGDGYISSESINLKITEQTLQQIAPVLFHMQEQRMVLDFDSFVYLIISFNILIY